MSNDTKTIFVGIGAYNEIDVISTIQNCLENATNPERIHFGLALHYSEMERPVLNFKNVKAVDIAFGALWGVCATRAMALNLYDGEDFYLQLDGHMKFDKDWDSYIINTYYEAQSMGFEKPLFTTYVPWWSTAEDGSIKNYEPVNDSPCSVMHFAGELFGQQIPQQYTSQPIWNNLQFAEHHGLSAHFIFVDADFIFDVPPDPAYMFYGEEPTTALRAWTRGYRIFAPKKATVWHKNKNKDDGVNHDRDRMNYVGYDYSLISHHDKKDALGWRKAEKVLRGDILGIWGAPTYQLYLDYVKASQFSFNAFYAKNMQYEINRLDPSYDLGYNEDVYKFYENKKLEAREANNAQSNNYR